MDKNCDTYILDDSITADKDDTITISSLFGLDYGSTDMTMSATLGSAGSTGSTLRTSLGTVGSIGAGNVTWTTPGTITSGGYLNTTGAAGSLTGATYANVTTSWNGWNTTYQQPQVLKVAGNAEFEGEVTIRGVKLDERLDAIEERLGILRPNNDLEGKWEKLKALGDEYRALEKDILEKEKIWDLLKK